MKQNLSLSLRLSVVAMWMTAAVTPVHADSQIPSQARQCTAYHAGQEHVLRTYCDGPGTMHLQLNGLARDIKGGKCETVGGMPSFNAGVVTEMGAAPAADYVGLATTKFGLFSGAVLAVRLDGKNYLLMNNHGLMGAHGGTVQASGHALGPGRTPATLVAEFSC